MHQPYTILWRQLSGRYYRLLLLYSICMTDISVCILIQLHHMKWHSIFNPHCGQTRSFSYVRIIQLHVLFCIPRCNYAVKHPRLSFQLKRVTYHSRICITPALLHKSRTRKVSYIFVSKFNCILDLSSIC